MNRPILKQPDKPAALKVVAPRTWAHWMLEAQAEDGTQLWTRVTFNHSTRGKWQALLLRPDGKIERLARVPNIKARRWVAWTDYAAEIIAAGRLGV